MSAREQMLARIRGAMRQAEADDTTPPDERPPRDVGPVPPDQSRPVRTHGELVERFAERVADYRASVRRCAPDDVRETIAAALAELPASAAVAAPAGFPDAWRPASVDRDGSTSDVAALVQLDAVVTACRVVIAETGTIVLDHGADQGPRRLTLVPDVHVCVVAASQVVADVDDAFAVLAPAGGADPATTPPLTFVSGPSATSDIELQRVEGVHGPRTLIVVLVDDAAAA